MNHCDGWPSKGNPLKLKVVGIKEMQGEVGEDSSRNKILKRQTYLKING
jgi:hypothetical protein